MRRFLAAALLISATAASADVTLVTEVVAAGKARTFTLTTKGTRASFELREQDGTSHRVLRDTASRTLFFVDHPGKTLHVLTEVNTKPPTPGERAAGRARLEARVAKLPVEERDRAEAFIQELERQAAGMRPEAPLTWVRRGTPPRNVNGFTCDDYLLERDGQARGEACLASWKSAGLTAEEFKQQVLGALPPPGTGPGYPLQGETVGPGFPVWRKALDSQGNVTVETTVKSVSKAAVPAEQVEPPRGYAQKAIDTLVALPPTPGP